MLYVSNITLGSAYWKIQTDSHVFYVVKLKVVTETKSRRELYWKSDITETLKIQKLRERYSVMWEGRTFEIFALLYGFGKYASSALIDLV